MSTSSRPRFPDRSVPAWDRCAVPGAVGGIRDGASAHRHRKDGSSKVLQNSIPEPRLGLSVACLARCQSLYWALAVGTG